MPRRRGEYGSATAHPLPPTLIRVMTVLVSGVFASSLLCACVPIPYRPSVSIQHEAVSQESASAVQLKMQSSGWLGKIGEELKRTEPRILFIDGAAALPGANDFISLPNAIAALSRLPPGPAAPDFLLGLSAFTDEKVHDTNYYVPLVGYDREQYVARLPSLLVDLRSGQPAEALDFESQYSMVVVQMFYGVMTVPMPQSAIHSALVAEVSRRLRAAQPHGPIRLLVMFQKQQELPKAQQPALETAPDGGSKSQP
jgi:hypothetical protein